MEGGEARDNRTDRKCERMRGEPVCCIVRRGGITRHKHGTDGNGLRGVVYGTHRWEPLKGGMWVQRLPFLRVGGWGAAMERNGVKGDLL